MLQVSFHILNCELITGCVISSLVDSETVKRNLLSSFFLDPASYCERLGAAPHTQAQHDSAILSGFYGLCGIWVIANGQKRGHGRVIPDMKVVLPRPPRTLTYPQMERIKSNDQLLHGK